MLDDVAGAVTDIELDGQDMELVSVVLNGKNTGRARTFPLGPKNSLSTMRRQMRNWKSKCLSGRIKTPPLKAFIRPVTSC